jgi:hypothetical protein
MGLRFPIYLPFSLSVSLSVLHFFGSSSSLLCWLLRLVADSWVGGWGVGPHAARPGPGRTAGRRLLVSEPGEGGGGGAWQVAVGPSAVEDWGRGPRGAGRRRWRLWPWLRCLQPAGREGTALALGKEGGRRSTEPEMGAAAAAACSLQVGRGRRLICRLLIWELGLAAGLRKSRDGNG